MTAQRGDLLHNRYELLELIATGGMGEVWRAQDTRLNRDVAVKLLKPELAGQRGFLDRFRIEARNAALLTHPNVCAVFDYGETDVVAESPNTPPTAYLVMELVPGEPLSSIIAREAPLAPERVLDYLRQAASGLGAAHAAGVVHRDVKPGNLLVTPEGVVKITDFGVARASGQSNLTATGQVMGTAQYLAPEQALGETVTPAADNYALGVVGYQALTGAVPFVRESQVATALAQVNDPPPPLPNTVPPQVQELVMGLLRKEPETRPANGRDLAAAIMAVEAGQHAALPTDTSTVALTTNQTAPTTMLRRGQAPQAARRSTGATTAPGQPPRRSGARLPLIFLLGLLLALGAWAGYRALAKSDTNPTNPATVTRTSRSTVTVTTGSGTTSRTSTPSTTKPWSSSSTTATRRSSTDNPTLPSAVPTWDQGPSQGAPSPEQTTTATTRPSWQPTSEVPPTTAPGTTESSNPSPNTTGSSSTVDTTAPASAPSGRAADPGAASGAGVISEGAQ